MGDFLFLELKKQVESILNDAVVSLGYEIDSLYVEASQHSDVASNIAFRLASKYRQNPKDIAEKIGNTAVIGNNSYIGKMEVTGPYLNFWAKRNYLDDTVLKIRKEKEDFASNFSSGDIILEHTSANPNGPLHVGHIRNSVIGDTLSRVLKHAGYNVRTQYYVNDIGRQIAIVSWGLKNFGFDESKKSDHAIADLYIRSNQELEKDTFKVQDIDRLMQMVENGDDDTIKIFDESVRYSLEGTKQTLKTLNVSHDEFVYESEFIRNGSVSKIIDELKSTGHTEIDNGALVVDLSDYGFEKQLVIQRSDGTSLYTTRDLSYHEQKSAESDRVIDILGADHKLVSSQLKATMNLLGKKEPEVVIFEFVSLPEGSMSTRKGKFITADDVFDKVKSQAYKEVDKRRPDMPADFKKEISDQVGMGAVRYDIVSVSPEKSTVFDWKKALDFEKQGGPYVQYSHARACNILKKAKTFWNPENSVNPSVLVEDDEVALIKKMAKFDQVIDRSAKELKPHTVATYARELADDFNQFYRYVPVNSAEDDEVRYARLALVDCARIMLANTLYILGISAPESM